MDQPTDHSGTLVLFDFDGTLVELATDYVRLHLALDELAPSAETARRSGLLQRLLTVYGAPDLVEAASAAVDGAEIRGLNAGRIVSRGMDLYGRFAESGATIAIVTHNGRRVVDTFFAGEPLRAPDAVFDLRTLAAPKQDSGAIRDYVKHLSPSRTYVVGNGESDRALALALSAEYLDVHDA